MRDLQSQIERRDKANSQLTEDQNKSRDKIERLLQTIDELQSSDSSNQLQAKRAERDLREEKEKALRLERELGGWKGLRVERESLRASGTYRTLSDTGLGVGQGTSGEGNSNESVQGKRGASMEPGRIEIPQRKSSLTKGFL